MSKFSCFFSGNPTNKTETACTWGSTNSKPSGPISMIDQLEILSLSQVQFMVQFIKLVFGVAQLSYAIYSHGKV